MKIAVLVDLSPICKKAVEFGGFIAKKINAELILVHVSDFDASEDVVQEGMNNLGETLGSDLKVSTHIATGDFFSLIPSIVQDLDLDFVVVPTHGKVGLMQNLFGANILKLVKALPVPTLVVQDATKASGQSFDNILFPVGPHDNFDVKIKQTAAFAKLFGSNVVVYTVKNDVRGISDKLRSNIDLAKEVFERENVKHQVVIEEPSGYSVGYAKHILAYAKQNAIDVFSIMSHVSDVNGYIGNSDKENILLNEQNLPVLCTNM